MNNISINKFLNKINLNNIFLLLLDQINCRTAGNKNLFIGTINILANINPNYMPTLIAGSNSFIFALLLWIWFVLAATKVKLRRINWGIFSNRNNKSLAVVKKTLTPTLERANKKITYFNEAKFLKWVQPQIKQKITPNSKEINRTTNTTFSCNYKNTPGRLVAITTKIRMTGSLVFPRVNIIALTTNQRAYNTDNCNDRKSKPVGLGSKI